MNKFIFVFAFIFFFLTSSVNSCKSDNDFLIGEDIDVCSDICTYENVSAPGSYIPCDGSVSCYLTSYYPNSSIVSFFQPMDFNGTVFNKSLGNLLTQGVYSAIISCNKDAGWQITNFYFSVFDHPFSCQDTNDFTLGESIDLCMGACYYENSSSLGSFIPCDYTVQCSLTTAYPNGTNLLFMQPMALINNTFMYPLGNLTTEGKYSSTLVCNRVLGWKSIDFPFTVYKKSSSAPSYSGGYSLYLTNKSESYLVEKVIRIPHDIDNIITKFNNVVTPNNPKIGRIIFWSIIILLLFFKELSKLFRRRVKEKWQDGQE